MAELEKKANIYAKSEFPNDEFKQQIVIKSLLYGYEQGQKDKLQSKFRNCYEDCNLALENLNLEKENKELFETCKDKDRQLNKWFISYNEVMKENEELKAEIEKIKKIMNINDFCENVYHYLTCELDLYKADNFDCEVCRYTECTKRLKSCELE